MRSKAIIGNCGRGNRPWSEVDKFVLDQFIMKGGRVAFFVDPVSISADSLRQGQYDCGND